MITEMLFGIPATIVDWLLRFMAFGLVVLVIHFAIGRRRALLRSVVLQGAVLVMLGLPAAAVLGWLPRIPIACLPQVDLPPVARGDAAAGRRDAHEVAGEHRLPAAPRPDPGASIDSGVPTATGPTAAAGAGESEADPSGHTAHTMATPTRPPNSRSEAKLRAGATGGRPTLHSLLVPLYLAGAAILLLRLTWLLATAKRLASSGFAVTDPDWVAATGRLGGRFGWRGGTQLRCSKRVSVPVTLGLIKPVILLPPEILRSASPHQRDAILLHELCHVRRRDPLWQVLVTAAQAVHWLNPLVWILGRRVQVAREEVCDDLCAGAAEGDEYRRTLVSVAALARKRPVPALGAAMARSRVSRSRRGGLMRRIARIDAGFRASTCVLGWRAGGPITAVLLIVAGVILGLDPVPRTVRASVGPAADAETSIAGKVLDESGRAIAGATVHLRARARRGGSGGDVRRLTALTDAGGRWRFAVASEDLDGIELRVAHPHYIDDLGHSRPLPPPDSLRSGTAVLVMKKGMSLEGKVVDEKGAPVENALIMQALSYNTFGKNSPSRRTNAQGRFRFDGLRPGETNFVVEAPGFAPQKRRVSITKHASGESAGAESGSATRQEPLDFELAPGGRIRLHVTDQAGEPVAGAWIVVSGWDDLVTYDWRFQTDAAGRWVWSERPAGEFEIDIVKDGFMSVRSHRVASSSGEEALTLAPQLRLRGRVIDAESGEPVPSFQALRGKKLSETRRVYWNRQEAEHFTGGRFDVRFQEPAAFLLVRIEAAGYRAAESLPFKSDAGEQDLPDFRLVRDPGVEGVVQRAGGEPLAGAQVVLASRSQSVTVENGKCARHFRGLKVVTGEDGRFRFSSPPEEFTVVVLHEDGFALVPGDNLSLPSTPVTIEPWCRVRGRLAVEARPLAFEKVALRYYSQPGEPKPVRFIHRTETDANGSFAFTRLVPGEARVGHFFRSSKPTDMAIRKGYGHSVHVDVLPRATTEVAINAEGRKVRGAIVLPPGAGIEPDWTRGALRLKRIQPLPREQPKTREEIASWRRWHAAWWSTAAGKAHRKNEWSLDVLVKPDGSFTAPGVPAGRYRLTFSLWGSPVRVGVLARSGSVVGTLSHEFTVVEAPEGRPAALDLGLLELVLPRELKAGDPAPAFAVKSLDAKDGETLKLRDFRGKYVLLDFWATWCGPCVKDVPHLKKVYEDFGADERFVMLSLSADSDAGAPREFVKQNGIQWRQGLLGEARAALAKEYCIEGIPAVFLIDPDGKIAARDLRGPATLIAVAKALKDN